MKRPMVWILEDDQHMQEVYSEVLGTNFAVRSYRDIEDLVKALDKHQKPDVAILDLFLEGRRVHQEFEKVLPHLQGVPFFVVSGIDDADAVESSLRCGAVEYISKPFGMHELKLKIQRILQQNDKKAQSPIFLDPVSMSARNHQGQKSILTSKEYQILSILIESEDNHISRQEFLELLWKDEKVTRKTLDVHLCNIRRKLKLLGASLLFKDNGYRLSLDEGA